MKGQNTESRRNAIRILATGGAIVTAKALPQTWTKPVVDSVLLPAHAQTSPPGGGTPTQFSMSLTVPHTEGPGAVLNFSFNVAGLTPTGDATVTVLAVGDINDTTATDNEQYDIALEGDSLGLTNTGPECDPAGTTTTFTIPEADLITAAGDDSVDFTATAGNGLDSFCLVDEGVTDEVTITLEFPAVT